MKNNPIDQNATDILIALFEKNPDENLYFEGDKIKEFTTLSPNEINNAIDYLDERNLLDRLNFMGTVPYNFGQVKLNSKGNYIYHELQRETFDKENNSTKSQIISNQPLAAGSPFGFTDLDWEYVQKESFWQNSIKVVFGYQFESNHYDSKLLKDNLRRDFEEAIQKYNSKSTTENITLKFKSLAAGYGEHLFNQIARDIISSDIAVFETSDLNPNVMIEMGVALTWGKRVLPIKFNDEPKPPSDISGQTYASYLDNGTKYLSETHEDDLIAMIERVVQKKRKY